MAHPFVLRCWSNPLHPECWDVPPRGKGPNLHHCLDTGLAFYFFGHHNSARWRFKESTTTECTPTIVCKFASPEKLVGRQPRCLLLLRRRQRRRGGLCRLPPAWDQGKDDPRHTVWNIFLLDYTGSATSMVKLIAIMPFQKALRIRPDCERGRRRRWAPQRGDGFRRNKGLMLPTRVGRSNGRERACEFLWFNVFQRPQDWYSGD